MNPADGAIAGGGQANLADVMSFGLDTGKAEFHAAAGLDSSHRDGQLPQVIDADQLLVLALQDGQGYRQGGGDGGLVGEPALADAGEQADPGLPVGPQDVRGELLKQFLRTGSGIPLADDNNGHAPPERFLQDDRLVFPRAGQPRPGLDVPPAGGGLDQPFCGASRPTARTPGRSAPASGTSGVSAETLHAIA